MSIDHVDGEGVIYLTVPEDARKGERVCIWTSQRALMRLRAEIDDTLNRIEAEGLAV